MIGRIEEKKQLINSYNSNCSEFIAIYGRRRIGKTYLVKETFEHKLDFFYTGIYNVTKKVQLKEFQSTLNYLENKNTKVPKDWFDAFRNLKQYLSSLNKTTVTVFLDELPWMDNKKSEFVQALANFYNTWDNYENKVLLKLYVCGSAASWMINKIISDKGGLYGRLTNSIYLKPFSLNECEKYFHEVKNYNYSRKEILDIYMIVGGIPYYLNMFDSCVPISINVDNLFFKEEGILKKEYIFLFNSLFSSSINYKKVVETLSNKLYGLTREEIIDETKIEGGELTETLNNLINCDFIRINNSSYNKKKSALYQLSDLYTLFYLRFVQNKNVNDMNGWTNMLLSGEKNAWSGYAFEQVCFHHILEIKKKLGISGILSNVCSYYRKKEILEDGTVLNGIQIDLLIDRVDNIINICEIKYSNEPYHINKEYYEYLLDRMSIYKLKTKTKKTLKCTFITVEGFTNSEYNRAVDSVICLNDLYIE